MKTKKVLAIILSTVLCAAVVVSAFLVMSVKKISVVYSVEERTDITEVEECLSPYLNKNIIFVKEDKIYQSLSGLSQFQVLSVKKEFPNVITVSVKERRPVFLIKYNAKEYLLDYSGHVINEKSALNIEESEIINLNLKGINITSLDIGKIVKTDFDDLFFDVLDMAREMSFTDSVNKIEIVNSVTEKDALFYTKTGVVIVVQDANVSGIDKIKKAFEGYRSADDYRKSYYSIRVYMEDSGAISCLWTKK